MPTIKNKWIEKEKKKKVLETAPSFESNRDDTWQPVDTTKAVKRFTNASNGTMKKTLRGLRK
jgi:hypothetical protein